MNKQDLFEEHIKKAVENYEAPFNTDSWKKIENRIPGNSAFGLSSVKNWVIGSVAIAAVATGFWFFTKFSAEVIEQDGNQTIERIIEPGSLNKSELTEEPNESHNNSNTKEIILVGKQEIKTGDNVNPLSSSGNDVDIENENSTRLDENVGFEPTGINTIDPLNTNDAEEASENLVVNWIISTDELCQGEEIVVSINNVNEPVEIIWDFGDGKTSTEPKVSHSYDSPGVYTIKLKANSLISGDKIYREKKYIEVRSNPQVDFRIEENENMAMLPEVNFSNTTKYANHIEWIFADVKTSNENSINKLYRYKGRYQIGLIVSNQFGCKDTVFKELVIENDYNLLAPKAFTPNEDGMNDFFIPKALAFLGSKFTMQVISNNGRVVFETKNVESPWNGKDINSGALLKNGPYAWTVKLEDGSVYSGTVLLMTD